MNARERGGERRIYKRLSGTRDLADEAGYTADERETDKRWAK